MDMMNSEGNVSDNLIMPREQVKASSWMPPSAAQLAWEMFDKERKADEIVEGDETNVQEEIF